MKKSKTNDILITTQEQQRLFITFSVLVLIRVVVEQFAQFGMSIHIVSWILNAVVVASLLGRKALFFFAFICTLLLIVCALFQLTALYEELGNSIVVTIGIGIFLECMAYFHSLGKR